MLAVSAAAGWSFDGVPESRREERGRIEVERASYELGLVCVFVNH